jgi:cobalt/nickel transport system permease protein
MVRLPRGNGANHYGLVLALISGLSLPQDAEAMHIAEGLLPFNWAALWFAVALPFLAWGLYLLNSRSREDLSFKPLVGLMAAVVFIISCLPIPVPFAGTCSHPAARASPAFSLDRPSVWSSPPPPW